MALNRTVAQRRGWAINSQRGIRFFTTWTVNALFGAAITLCLLFVNLPAGLIALILLINAFYAHGTCGTLPRLAIATVLSLNLYVVYFHLGGLVPVLNVHPVEPTSWAIREGLNARGVLNPRLLLVAHLALSAHSIAICDWSDKSLEGRRYCSKLCTAAFGMARSWRMFISLGGAFALFRNLPAELEARLLSVVGGGDFRNHFVDVSRLRISGLQTFSVFNLQDTRILNAVAAVVSGERNYGPSMGDLWAVLFIIVLLLLTLCSVSIAASKAIGEWVKQTKRPCYIDTLSNRHSIKAGDLAAWFTGCAILVWYLLSYHFNAVLLDGFLTLFAAQILAVVAFVCSLCVLLKKPERRSERLTAWSTVAAAFLLSFKIYPFLIFQILLPGLLLILSNLILGFALHRLREIRAATRGVAAEDERESRTMFSKRFFSSKMVMPKTPISSKNLRQAALLIPLCAAVVYTAWRLSGLSSISVSGFGHYRAELARTLELPGASSLPRPSYTVEFLLILLLIFAVALGLYVRDGTSAYRSRTVITQSLLVSLPALVLVSGYISTLIFHRMAGLRVNNDSYYSRKILLSAEALSSTLGLIGVLGFVSALFVAAICRTRALRFPSLLVMIAASGVFIVNSWSGSAFERYALDWGTPNSDVLVDVSLNLSRGEDIVYVRFYEDARGNPLPNQDRLANFWSPATWSAYTSDGYSDMWSWAYLDPESQVAEVCSVLRFDLTVRTRSVDVLSKVEEECATGVLGRIILDSPE